MSFGGSPVSSTLVYAQEKVTAVTATDSLPPWTPRRDRARGRADRSAQPGAELHREADDHIALQAHLGQTLPPGDSRGSRSKA